MKRLTELTFLPGEDPYLEIKLDDITVSMGEPYRTDPENSIRVFFSSRQDETVKDTKIEVKEDRTWPGSYLVTFKKEKS